MAAVEVTITGMLYDKTARTSQNVVLIGEASLTDVGVGGGPMPPGSGGGGSPPGIWPSPGHPAHPIAPGGKPPGIWGGAPPWVDNTLPPSGGGGGGDNVVMPPIYFPPEIWPKPPGMPPGFVWPPQVVVIWVPGMGYVAYPLPQPGKPDQGLPQPQPPTGGGSPPVVDNTLPQPQPPTGGGSPPVVDNTLPGSQPGVDNTLPGAQPGIDNSLPVQPPTIPTDPNAPVVSPPIAPTPG